MVKFECNLCGKCCQSFGRFIKIERQINDRDYFTVWHYKRDSSRFMYCRNLLKKLMKNSPVWMEKNTGPSHKGCIFLRENPQGKGFVCAVYPTRPSVCREFLCYRMLIFHQQSGELRGKVIGINELKTQDETLAALWKEKIVHISHPSASPHAEVQHSRSPGTQASPCHDSHLPPHIHGVQHAGDHEWVNNVITILAYHGYRAENVE